MRSIVKVPAFSPFLVEWIFIFQLGSQGVLCQLRRESESTTGKVPISPEPLTISETDFRVLAQCHAFCGDTARDESRALNSSWTLTDIDEGIQQCCESCAAIIGNEVDCNKLNDSVDITLVRKLCGVIQKARLRQRHKDGKVTFQSPPFHCISCNPPTPVFRVSRELSGHGQLAVELSVAWKHSWFDENTPGATTLAVVILCANVSNGPSTMWGGIGFGLKMTLQLPADLLSADQCDLKLAAANTECNTDYGLSQEYHAYWANSKAASSVLSVSISPISFEWILLEPPQANLNFSFLSGSIDQEGMVLSLWLKSMVGDKFEQERCLPFGTLHTVLTFDTEGSNVSLPSVFMHPTFSLGVGCTYTLELMASFNDTYNPVRRSLNLIIPGQLSIPDSSPLPPPGASLTSLKGGTVLRVTIFLPTSFPTWLIKHFDVAFQRGSDVITEEILHVPVTQSGQDSFQVEYKLKKPLVGMTVRVSYVTFGNHQSAGIRRVYTPITRRSRVSSSRMKQLLRLQAHFIPARTVGSTSTFNFTWAGELLSTGKLLHLVLALETQNSTALCLGNPGYQQWPIKAPIKYLLLSELLSRENVLYGCHFRAQLAAQVGKVVYSSAVVDIAMPSPPNRLSSLEGTEPRFVQAKSFRVWFSSSKHQRDKITMSVAWQYPTQPSPEFISYFSVEVFPYTPTSSSLARVLQMTTLNARDEDTSVTKKSVRFPKKFAFPIPDSGCVEVRVRASLRSRPDSHSLSQLEHFYGKPAVVLVNVTAQASLPSYHRHHTYYHMLRGRRRHPITQEAVGWQGFFSYALQLLVILAILLYLMPSRGQTFILLPPVRKSQTRRKPLRFHSENECPDSSFDK